MRRRDVDEEIQSHLAMAVRDRIAAGEDPASAELAAIREFGNVTLTSEATKSVWRRGWEVVAADVWQDVCYAARLLRRSPMFSGVVVMVLGLGIGANATVFTLFKAIFLKPLPGVVAPADLQAIVARSSGGRTVGLSYPDYEYLRDHQHVFSNVTASGMSSFNLGIGNRAERVWGEMVTGNYFEMLGVRASLGRTLMPSDNVAPGQHPVAVITDGLWRRAFSADPAIVGQTIHINAHPLTVVGVLEPAFHGTVVSLVMDIFIPAMEQPVIAAAFRPVGTPQAPVGTGMLRQRNTQWVMVLGRPSPGVSLAQSAADVRVLAAQLAADNPTADFSQRAEVLPLWRSPYGAQTYLLPVVILLGVMGGVILLIVCANVANLVLARGLTRRGEIAVRTALGAARARVMRLLLIENVILAVPGALAGIVLARALLPLASFGSTPIAPMQVELDLSTDRLVTAYALALSCASAVVFGFVPAFRISRVNLADVMKDELSPRGAGRTRLRSALVVVQLAMSVLLLVGAALVLRSLNASRTANVGFDPNGVVSLSLDLKPNGYDEARGRVFYQQLLDNVRAMPRVEAATVAAYLPLTLVDGSSWSVTVEKYVRRKDEDLSFLYNIISPGYFETLRVGLVAGRVFDRHDDTAGPLVAIVNDTMAKRFWKTPEAALGQRIRVVNQWRTIVGVAKDLKYARVTESPRPYFYLPQAQQYFSNMTLQVRAGDSANDLIARLRPVVQAMDPNLPILEARPLSEQVRVALAGYELAAGTLIVFGVMAIGLAAIGLYGLVAYAVEQNRHELGICLALGASRADVLRRFLVRGLRLGTIGAAIGVLGAFATTRLMSSVLYGVSAADPRSFAFGVATVMTITVIASFLPAWRASRTDPVTALRRH